MNLLIMSLADFVMAGAGALSVLVINREVRGRWREFAAVRAQLKEIRRKGS